ncbi:MAG: substrate-binding domain-containing protein [Gemmatimonadaceae bacterium]|nr:substrate-binding domain-containing protein [Gemmatimonadaceae bacterium]
MPHLLVEHLGPAAHPDRLVTLTCDDLATMRAVVRGSDAVLLAMQASVRGAVAAGELVPLQCEGVDRLDFRVGLARLRDRTLPPAVARFEALVRRCYAD